MTADRGRPAKSGDEHRRLTYTDERTTAFFEWRGGPYIDITMPGETAPEDCINLYDYETGGVGLEHSQDNLELKAREYIDSGSLYDFVRGAHGRERCASFTIPTGAVDD